MGNKIKRILLAAAVSSLFFAQGVSAAQFDDGEQLFSDGTDSSDATGSVSALASTLAKQTEEETQKFVEKEEEPAQVREERRIEKAEKASEKRQQHWRIFSRQLRIQRRKLRKKQKQHVWQRGRLWLISHCNLREILMYMAEQV